MDFLHDLLRDLLHWQFIDDSLGWLTIAFVVLLVLGFWIAGRGARRATREAE